MQKHLLKSLTIVLIILFCLTQLSGCSFLHRPTRDGAPSRDFDASKIPDAVPRAEPLNPSCNKSYTVHGHRYHVLKSTRGYNKVGVASWYGTKFHKHRTSTGEAYNLYSMTAASTTLPLPCYVKVTNLKNGKHVVVRVNDRGPFRQNRILDLSYAAAKKLGFANHGTAKVRVVAINTGHPPIFAHTKHHSKHRHRQLAMR